MRKEGEQFSYFCEFVGAYSCSFTLIILERGDAGSEELFVPFLQSEGCLANFLMLNLQRSYRLRNCFA